MTLYRPKSSDSGPFLKKPILIYVAEGGKRKEVQVSGRARPRIHGTVVAGAIPSHNASPMPPPQLGSVALDLAVLAAPDKGFQEINAPIACSRAVMDAVGTPKLAIAGEELRIREGHTYTVHYRGAATQSFSSLRSKAPPPHRMRLSCPSLLMCLYSLPLQLPTLPLPRSVPDAQQGPARSLVRRQRRPQL